MKMRTRRDEENHEKPLSFVPRGEKTGGGRRSVETRELEGERTNSGNLPCYFQNKSGDEEETRSRRRGGEVGEEQCRKSRNTS